MEDVMTYGEPNRAAATGELYPISQQERDEIAASLVNALNAKEIVMAAYKASMASYKSQLKEINTTIEAARQRANNAGIGTSIDELAANYLGGSDFDTV